MHALLENTIVFLKMVHGSPMLSHELLHSSLTFFLLKPDSFLKLGHGVLMLLIFDLVFIVQSMLEHVVVPFHCEVLAPVVFGHFLVVTLQLLRLCEILFDTG